VSSTTGPSVTPAAVTAASCPHRYTAAALVTCITTAEAVYLAMWQKDLAVIGVRNPTPPRIVIFSAIPENPCISSEGDAAEASFWCDKNNTLYVAGNAAQTWTVYYAKAAAAHHVLASDAKTAGTTVADLLGGYPLVGATTEFAHELGHWAQQVSGQMAWYDERVANPDFAVSAKAESTREGSADCLSGWMQARTAAAGTWVDTPIGRWAHHATMAELGYDLESVKPNFTYPKERPADVNGYGSSYTRLKFYDMGYAAGRAGKPGLTTCSRTVANYLSAPLPPHS
jgi:predicted metalloprotease